MYRKNRRSLNIKKNPQKFLQYGLDENKFKMVLLNGSNPSIVPMAPVLPSGFKPLSSSTPKRSRDSFEIIDKPVTRCAPAAHLKMAQFIGEIPGVSEQNQSSRSSNKKNTSVKSISKSFETSASSNEIIAVHVKPERSTSCEPWDSFQKKLRKILNTSVRDLNTIEKILKLIFQFNEHSKYEHCHDENVQNFENYVKIKALIKAHETADNWNTRKEVFSDNMESKEGLDFGTFKVPEESLLFNNCSDKPTLKDFEILIANDMTTETGANETPKPIALYSNRTDDNTLDSILEFSCSSKNNNRQKKTVDSKISTMSDSSIFKRIFSDSFETREFFDKKSKKCASFKVSEAPLLSKSTKTKNSYTKIRRIQNHKDFYDILKKKKTRRLCRCSHDPKAKESQFEKEFQKLLKATTQSGKQQNKILKAPPSVKTFSKDFEITSLNETITTRNNTQIKPQLGTSVTDSNTTEDILEWILQLNNSSAQNNKHQRKHPNGVFENLGDINVSTLVSTTIDGLSIF